MKKAARTKHDPDVLDEYDFSSGVRGKHAKRYAEGTNVVVLAPDVAAVFPDAQSVNEALRVLARIARGNGKKRNLEAKVASLGGPYADGTPNLEINLPAAQAASLAFVGPRQTVITLRIAGRDYTASVLANKPKHKKVWLSPTLVGPGGERLTLGRVLTDAGFRANDTVALSVSGNLIEVLPRLRSSGE